MKLSRGEEPQISTAGSEMIQMTRVDSREIFAKAVKHDSEATPMICTGARHPMLSEHAHLHFDIFSCTQSQSVKVFENPRQSFVDARDLVRSLEGRPKLAAAPDCSCFDLVNVDPNVDLNRRSPDQRMGRCAALRCLPSFVPPYSTPISTSAKIGIDGMQPLQGPLGKRGRWNTTWRTRHFVLNLHGDLDYYTSEAAAARCERPRGTIPIAPRTVGPAAKTFVTAGGWDGGRALILVRVPAAGRTYVLGAATAAAQSVWVAELRTAARGEAVHGADLVGAGGRLGGAPHSFVAGADRSPPCEPPAGGGGGGPPAHESSHEVGLPPELGSAGPSAASPTCDPVTSPLRRGAHGDPAGGGGGGGTGGISGYGGGDECEKVS